MSLLQHPLRSIEQIEWYLENKQFEAFPGAFLLAAGNLARQVLEQIVFIIAFYSGMPTNKYLKTSNKLCVLGKILPALQETDPISGLRYIELARRRGPRIRKLTRLPRSLERWRKLFNEPSHFSNPATIKNIKEKHIRNFANHFSSIFEDVDGYLITAAVNEIRSNGTVKAILSSDVNNVPGVQCDLVVTHNNFKLHNCQLILKMPTIPVTIVPANKEVPYRWSNQVVLVQHSHGMQIGFRVITESGTPVNLTNMQTVISSFLADDVSRDRLIKRFKKLGLSINV